MGQSTEDWFFGPDDEPMGFFLTWVTTSSWSIKLKFVCLAVKFFVITVIKFKLNVRRRVLVELIAFHILWNSKVQYRLKGVRHLSVS
jgi:hypothetical protein